MVLRAIPSFDPSIPPQILKSQKLIFAASWICRGGIVSVYRP